MGTENQISRIVYLNVKKKSNSENLTYGSSYGATSDGCTLYTAGGSG